MSGVTLRRAHLQEAHALGELAFRSKAHWGYTPAFMQACRDELRVDIKQLADGWVTVAEVDGVVAAFAAIWELGPTRYDLTHLFVDPAYLRRGIGARLLTAVRRQVAQMGGEILEVQSDPHAAHFYAARGGQPAGSEASQSIPGRVLPCFEFACAPASA